MPLDHVPATTLENLAEDLAQITARWWTAIATQNLEQVRSLLISGFDPDSLHPDSAMTALEIAAEKGALTLIQTLLQAGALLDAGELSPLGLAAQRGDLAALEMLLRAQPGPSLADKCDALMMATSSDQPQIVQRLLAAGALADSMVWEGGTALHYATDRGHTAVVDALLAAGAEVNLADPDQGWTPLMYAAYDDRADIAQRLIAAGADLNARDPQGRTPLILAAEACSAQVAEILIAAGADTQAMDENGNSAASWVDPCETSEAAPRPLTLEALHEEILAEQSYADDLETSLQQLAKAVQTLESVEKSGRSRIAQLLGHR